MKIFPAILGVITFGLAATGHAIEPPGWAVGKFSGTNPKYSKRVTVEIYRSGDVTVSVTGQASQSGSWGSGGYSVGGLRFYVERGNNAIVVTQANDSSNRATYKYSGPTSSSGWSKPSSDDSPPDYLRGFHKSGKNSFYNAKVDLNVDLRGNASATVRYADGRVQYQSGFYRDGSLWLDDTRFRTYRSSGGFTIEEASNSRNRTVWGSDGWGGVNPPDSGSSAPDWIVGEFDGHNRYYDADIHLTVRRDGYSVADVRFSDGRRQTQTGTFRDGRLTLNGVGFKVSRAGSGFSTEQMGNSGNWMEYRRQGGFGSSNDWGQSWSDAPSWMVGTFRGYNNLYDADVDVHISRDGSATIDIYFKDGRRQKQRGGYRNGRLRIEGIEFEVREASNGITLRQVDDTQNKNVYRRTY